jgi:NAD(P)-dependent dehydrogenase (short-subunit alcohol dehydrogenase family)
VSRAILICGGTGAIGRAIVAELSGRGERIAFSGRSRERGADLEAETGATFIPHSDRSHGAELVEAAAARLGGLDGLVLNAGAIEHLTLAETTPAQLRELLWVNVTVPIAQAQAAAGLLPPGGAVVAVASNAGLWGEVEIGAYSVSKAALLAACRALAVELGGRQIRVNAVCPGDTEPGMAASRALAAEPFTVVPPLGRLGQPADTAAAVAHLLSPDASFTTGAALLVDGGMHGALDAWSSV